MSNLQQFLEQLFDRGHQFLSDLSEHWQKHTNRRTILLLLFVSTAALVNYVTLIEAPEKFPVDYLITIPEGTSLSQTAGDFQQLGIIRSSTALKFIVKLSGHEHDIHAGDYLFKSPKNVFEIAHAISVGAYGLEPTRIRVPEGATVESIARIFTPQLQRFQKERFISEAKQWEGFLFPDTYFFLPNADDKRVLDSLRNNFEEHFATLQREYGTSTRSRINIVTMASILEREAKKMDDRRLIAGILWKRLDKGMPLQVDAVFYYTLGKYTPDITTKDLLSDSPYNTYRFKGLPPTPIGAPSMDALIAAITPIKTEYYFFLADHNNVTHYSKTYEEHLQKKKQYLGT